MLQAKPTIHQNVLKHQNLLPRPDPDTFSPLSTFNTDSENFLALKIPSELLWTLPGLAAVLKLPRTGRLLTRRGAPAVPQTPTNPQLISNPSCQPDNALCPSCCSNFFSWPPPLPLVTVPLFLVPLFQLIVWIQVGVSPLLLSPLLLTVILLQLTSSFLK